MGRLTSLHVWHLAWDEHKAKKKKLCSLPAWHMCLSDGCWPQREVPMQNLAPGSQGTTTWDSHPQGKLHLEMTPLSIPPHRGSFWDFCLNVRQLGGPITCWGNRFPHAADSTCGCANCNLFFINTMFHWKPRTGQDSKNTKAVGCCQNTPIDSVGPIEKI